MTRPEDLEIEEELESAALDEPENADYRKAKADLEARASRADLRITELNYEGEMYGLRLDMKCARESRPVLLSSLESIRRILEFNFEDFVFMRQHNAIASYAAGTIEAAIRPVGAGIIPYWAVFRRLFTEKPDEDFDLSDVCVDLPSPAMGLPNIRIGPASSEFSALVPRGSSRLTLKLSQCNLGSHDESLKLLTRTADALFFQIDMLTGIPVNLERERRPKKRRPGRSRISLNDRLEYPKHEYDQAPSSLYWYGRSASGMPLLQFLAFYQVVEFYFPVYAEAEAKRKLMAILKDPTFRGDRESDIGRLLMAIQASRTSGLGSELQQLRTAINECIDPAALYEFLVSDEDRKAFYSAKHKYHRVTVSDSTPNVDLRSDAAERIYDIRCGIVHAKNNSSEDIALLLPFSKEADELMHDIELMEFVAKSVLVAASIPFGIGG
jgi:hypothetical protein